MILAQPLTQFIIAIFAVLLLSAIPANSKKETQIEKQFQLGKQLIKNYQCSSCHIIDGQGADSGISLDRLKRSEKFIVNQVMDPEDHVMRNAKSFNFEPNLMPSHQLTLDEARAMALYLTSKDLKKNLPKARMTTGGKNEKRLLTPIKK